MEYALTLEELNKLFDLNFTNGHLQVYLDEKVEFNYTKVMTLGQYWNYRINILENMNCYIHG